MTVQSHVAEAVSHSADLARDTLQWNPSNSESMKALVRTYRSLNRLRPSLPLLVSSAKIICTVYVETAWFLL